MNTELIDVCVSLDIAMQLLPYKNHTFENKYTEVERHGKVLHMNVEME